MRLQAFADDIWVADGPRVNSIGPWKHPTRMVVVRLADGSLWINSPIPATEEEMRDLKEFGPVRYLIAPIRYHSWRVAAWKSVFPEAEVWGHPVSARSKTFLSIGFWEILRRRRGSRISIR